MSCSHTPEANRSWLDDANARPRSQGRGPIHERAPGRAGGLQSRRTGFDSSRSCLIEADVAEQRGGGFVNRIILVQFQSSALMIRPDGVADRTGHS